MGVPQWRLYKLRGPRILALAVFFLSSRPRCILANWGGYTIERHDPFIEQWQWDRQRVLEVVLMDGMGTVTSRKEKVYIRSLELRA
jgi:hypothetical protein